MYRCSSFDYSVISDIFIDTSVWFYTTGPQAERQSEKSHIYGESLKKILEYDIKIHTLQIIHSEYYNLLVAEYHKMYDNSVNRKRYMKTDDYKENIGNMLEYYKSFAYMANIQTLDINLPDKTVENIVKQGVLGMNDAIIARYCEINRIILLTDDQDFNAYPKLEVISK